MTAQRHSQPTQWLWLKRAEATGRVLPDELRVSSFPDRFPHFICTAAQSALSGFVWSRVYACLGGTCHLHFWQNDRGLLRATAVTRGCERTPSKSQHTKLTLEKKFFSAAPAGIRTHNLSITSPALYQQAIPLHLIPPFSPPTSKVCQ